MSLNRWIARTRRFFREYTSGVEAKEVHKVLGRDATRAFDVLTRDHPEQREPEGFSGMWDRSRRLFLGLSYKLTPPRRVLFAICIVLALLGLYRGNYVIGSLEIHVASNPLLMISSIAGLVFLLVLELADRVVVRDELEVARQLQAELMADRSPDVEGYDFAFSYRTANTIGGDYYQFVTLEDGRLLVAAGDASGHGIAAGLLMAVANATLLLAADRDPDPAAVASIVNGALYRTGGRRAFMTLFCAVLEPTTGRFSFVCAGHPFPLLRGKDGSVEELGTGALPLGIRRELPLEVVHVTIDPGDAVVMNSDGIPEMLGAEQQAYGFVRLTEVVKAGGSARQLHDRVLADLDTFAAGELALDDQSLVVMVRHPA